MRAPAGSRTGGRQEARAGPCRWGWSRSGPPEMPSSRPYSSTSKSRERDQARRLADERPQRPALQTSDAVADGRGVATAVEGQDERHAGSRGGVHRQGARRTCGTTARGRRPTSPSATTDESPGATYRSALRGHARTRRTSKPSRISRDGLVPGAIRGQHRDGAAALGETARDLDHVLLDAARVGREAGCDHEDARGHVDGGRVRDPPGGVPLAMVNISGCRSRMGLVTPNSCPLPLATGRGLAR